MKLMRILLVLLLAVVVVGVAVRNVVLKQQLQKIIAQQTGFVLELNLVNLGLASTSFDVEGMRLLNPADFPEPLALEVKQVRVDYDFWSLFSREIRFREVVLDVTKLVLVRKADGETNAERLGGGGRAKTKPPAPKPAPREEPAPPAPGDEKAPTGFRIDRLVLRVGTVEYHDYTKAQNGGAPGLTSMTLNVDQEHRDVTSLGQLGSLVLGGSIQQMGLFLLNKELTDQDSDLNKKIKKTADKVQRSLDKLFGAPQEK